MMTISATRCPGHPAARGRSACSRLAASLAGCLLVLLLAACGSDNSAPTGDTRSDNVDTTTDANQNADTPPLPETAPVDAEAPPDVALGATRVLRVSDTQRITYADSGAPDEPTASSRTLLLLHDFGGSAVHWRRITGLLAARHRVIAMDMRGHGNSTRSNCCNDVAALVQDIQMLAQALQLPSLTVVGSGGGAHLARQLAVQSPDRVNGVVLIADPAGLADSTGNGEDSGLLSGWLTELDAQGALAGPSDEFLDSYNNPGADRSAAADQALAQLRTAQRSTAASTWAWGLRVIQQAGLSPALATISAPVMLLTGQADTVSNRSGQVVLADRLRTEVAVQVAAAGRYPAIEKPAETADLILKFLSPRGTLHDSQAASDITRGEVDNLGDGLMQELLVREITGEPACSIRWYRIEYQTTGASGESTNASAGVAIPYGDPRYCTGERPLVLYAHGTSADRNYNTIESSEVGTVVSATVATHGSIIVAPDYAGYGLSWLDYHPYLNARANAADMIDALRAARQLIARLDDISAGPLYISGYSQGGYVAMATHREIEQHHADEFTVRASLPMSGPYALGNTVMSVLGGRVSDGASQLLPFFTEGYQRAYGNVYDTPSDLFNPPYEQTAIGLFPGSVSSGASIEQGLLPANTIAAQGDPYLLRDNFVQDYLANPQNTLRQAVERNSLIADWTPAAPMQLCGSNKDTVVFYDNTIDAVNAFANRGVNVRYYDFNRAATFDNDAFDRRYLTFRTLILFADDSEYHVAVAPFCLALVRAYISDDPRP